jgi:hypothetical protein
VQNFIPQCNQKKIMQNYLKETNSKIFEKVDDGRQVMAIAHLTLWVR